jgi:nucleoside phosphorylase
VVAREVLAADGTSRNLGAGERIAADRELTAALAAAAHGNPSATVVSTDLFYEHDRAREQAWRAAGAIAVEMEAAALFAVGARAGIPVACVLAVSDLIGENPGDRHARIDDDALLAAAEAMGRAAVSALV